MRADPRAGSERRVEPSGELFILSAPSAAGKTTLIRRLLERRPELAAGLEFSVSHTTRPARRGEVAGRDYHFVAPAVFREMIAAGSFLEWAIVHGRYYGTSLEAVEGPLAAGRDVILDIDVQGARQVRAHYPEAPAIFVMAPSYEVLEERLRSRALDSEEQIERRLRTALEEMREYGRYDYVILNEDLDRACDALAAVLLARRVRRDRMQPLVDRILASFPF